MAAPEERALLSIEGLTKAYAGVTALDAAVFQVAARSMRWSARTAPASRH